MGESSKDEVAAEDMALLGIAMASAEKEADRMWTRFKTFFLVNGALAAALTTDFVPEKKHRIVLACCGILLCLLWFHIIRLSVFYETRWFRAAIKIIERNGWESRLTPRISDVGRPFPWGSSRHCLYVVVVLFVFGWAALILLGL